MNRLFRIIRSLIGHRTSASLAVGCAAACFMLSGSFPASATVPPHLTRPPHQAFGVRSGVLADLGSGRHGRVPRSAAGPKSASVVLDGSPGAPAANPWTNTVYVPIQCRIDFCPSSGTPGHVVDIINAARCNAKTSSSCRVVARARVGSGPLAVAIDQKTDTVYVANGNSGTVSVLDGARCNGTVTSGCDHLVGTIKVGQFPVAEAVNPATRTLYVANAGGGSLSVINAATCNAKVTRGCRQTARTVRDKAGPDWVGVDVATDTVYAANAGTGAGDTVSVINGATCNGRTGRGCGKIAATVTVGANPFALTVDRATDTIYVASNSDGTVSVIDGTRCNAKATAGCGTTPPTVTTGAGLSFVGAADSLHTIFALNAADDTVSAINIRTCNGRHASGCGKQPPSQKAAPDQGRGYVGFPGVFALIPQTRTAYVMNEGGANTMAATNISRCNSTDTAGCRRIAPRVGDSDFLIATDPTTDTIYAASLGQPQIDVISGATCHLGQVAGCAPVAEIPMANPGANVGDIDYTTHTLYAANSSSTGTVAVINTAACNAQHTGGCAAAPPTISIGPFPNAPIVNPATKTMYVSYGSKANRVAVVNMAHCNATTTAGCGQTPAVVRVGAGTFVLAVSRTTDTIYGPSSGSSFNGDTVAVINGATCDGTDHSACGHPTATATVGSGPFGVAVNDATHSVYVVNNADGDSAGSVTIINSATCNGTHAAGCRDRFHTMAAGRSPLFIAQDTSTGALFVTDFSGAEVTILDGSRCNAVITAGCSGAPRERAVASQPFGLAINQLTNTVYVTSLFQAGSMSILRADG